MADGGEMLVKTVTWANSAPQNTEKVIDVPSDGHGAWRIAVYNPSSVSDLAVQATVTEPQFVAEGGHDVLAKSFTALKNGAVTFQAVADADGWITASTPGKIKLKNSTVLGGADTFSATVRLRRV